MGPSAALGRCSFGSVCKDFLLGPGASAMLSVAMFRALMFLALAMFLQSSRRGQGGAGPSLDRGGGAGMRDNAARSSGRFSAVRARLAKKTKPQTLNFG